MLKRVAETASILHAPISIVMRTGIPSQKLQYTRGTKQMDSGFVVGQPRARMLLRWPRQKSKYNCCGLNNILVDAYSELS